LLYTLPALAVCLGDAAAQSFGVAPTIQSQPFSSSNETAAPRGAQPAPVPKEVTDANRHLRRGETGAALARIESLLERDPREPRGRFTLGLIRIEQGRDDDAIAVFTGLTQDFPELPEPYNNLAVLQARQGRLDTARSSLLAALRANPDDAIARENLGDVYVMLAREAFEASLRNGGGNRGARAKLNVLRDLSAPPTASDGRTDTQQAEGASR